MNNLETIIKYDKIKKEFNLDCEKYNYRFQDCDGNTRIGVFKYNISSLNARVFFEVYNTGHQLIMKQSLGFSNDELRDVKIELEAWLNEDTNDK